MNITDADVIKFFRSLIQVQQLQQQQLESIGRALDHVITGMLQGE